MTLQRGPGLLPGGDVPQPQHSVGIAGDDTAAVRAEFHADDPVRMSQRLAYGPAGVDVPQPRGAVSTLPVAIMCPSGLNDTAHTWS